MVKDSTGPSPYAQRLAQAMSLDTPNMTAVALANKLGVTRQAVEKFLRGDSGEMKAGNHEKTAQILGVDSRWLALGIGVARPGDFQVRWHERTLIEQFRELPPEDQEDVAEIIRSKLELVRQHAGKRSSDPYQGIERRTLPRPITDTGAPALRPKAKKSTK